MTDPPAGAWVGCPHCGAEVSLARFHPADDEPDVDVASCPACVRPVVLPTRSEG